MKTSIHNLTMMYRSIIKIGDRNPFRSVGDPASFANPHIKLPKKNPVIEAPSRNSRPSLTRVLEWLVLEIGHTF